jgi:hypothetical protein
VLESGSAEPLPELLVLDATPELPDLDPELLDDVATPLEVELVAPELELSPELEPMPESGLLLPELEVMPELDVVPELLLDDAMPDEPPTDCPLLLPLPLASPPSPPTP